MKIKHILLLSVILSLTFIGYTFHTTNNEYIEDPDEYVEIEEEPDYSLEIVDFLEEYKQFFLTKFQEYGSVGGALTIVYKGQVVCLQPYGVKKIRTTDSVDVNTVFRLASVSKGFAGVLASKLHHAHTISLDSTIVSYMPDFKLKRKSNTTCITLENTLSHTSGVVAHSFDKYIESGIPFSKIYSSMPIANIFAQPGKSYSYQNILFSLLDTILASHTGKPYETWIQKEIFNPLGMIDASVSYEGFTKSQNYAYPHKGWKKNTRALKLNKKYYEAKPAAGVNASIADMSKWLQAMLGYAPEVLDSVVLADVAQSRIRIKDRRKYAGKRWSFVKARHYSLGWRVFEFADTKILYHGGFVDGYRAEVVVWPEKQIAMAMLLNSSNNLAKEAVPIFISKYMNFVPTLISEQNIAYK